MRGIVVGRAKETVSLCEPVVGCVIFSAESECFESRSADLRQVRVCHCGGRGSRGDGDVLRCAPRDGQMRSGAEGGWRMYCLS